MSVQAGSRLGPYEVRSHLLATRRARGAVDRGLKRTGLANLAPREWLAGNRIVFEAKSGDSSHIFDIGVSSPSWMARAWRLDPSPRRLTFGTAQDERPAASSPLSPAGLPRLAFASVSRKENVWSVAIDTNNPGSATSG